MKTILTTLALMTMTFVAAPASADWGCGSFMGVQPPLVALDACYGDSNTDNPYAGCNGDWQDLYEGNTDTYVQTCNDGSTHVWVCPMANPNYSVNGASCVPVTV